MFFDLRLNYASKIGLNLDKIILDPGIVLAKVLIIIMKLLKY